MQSGASAVCIGLSVACCMEAFVWTCRLLLLRSRPPGRRASRRRAAASAAAGLFPLALHAATGSEARAAAASVLMSAAMHASSAPFERVLGVACSRAASRGDARSCIGLCLLAFLGGVRSRYRRTHALIVPLILWAAIGTRAAAEEGALR